MEREKIKGIVEFLQSKNAPKDLYLANKKRNGTDIQTAREMTEVGDLNYLSILVTNLLLVVADTDNIEKRKSAIKEAAFNVKRLAKITNSLEWFEIAKKLYFSIGDDKEANNCKAFSFNFSSIAKELESTNNDFDEKLETDEKEKEDRKAYNEQILNDKTISEEIKYKIREVEKLENGYDTPGAELPITDPCGAATNYEEAAILLVEANRREAAIFYFDTAASIFSEEEDVEELRNVACNMLKCGFMEKAKEMFYKLANDYGDNLSIFFYGKIAEINMDFIAANEYLSEFNNQETLEYNKQFSELYNFSKKTKNGPSLT